MNIELRILKNNEISSGANVFFQAMNITDEDSKEIMGTYTQLISQNNIAIYVGAIEKQDNKILAIGALLLYQGSSTWITYIGTRPECQGRGYESLVFQRILNLAKLHGYKSLELYATKTGIPLYKKFGFREDYEVYMYKIAEMKKTELNNELTVGDELPEWVFTLDEESFGSNRKTLLKLNPSNNRKVIYKGKDGFGMLLGKKLGPVIARNSSLAIDIIKKSYELGADNLIIPHHEMLPNDIFEEIKLNKLKESRLIKMTYGNKAKSNLNNLYASRSFSFG